jgi:hypothetical protein
MASLDPETASIEAWRLEREALQADGGVTARLLNKASSLSEETALAVTATKQRTDRDDLEELKASFKTMLTANSKLLHKAMSKENGFDELAGMQKSTDSLDQVIAGAPSPSQLPTRKATPIMRPSAAPSKLLDLEAILTDACEDPTERPAEDVPLTPTTAFTVNVKGAQQCCTEDGPLRANHR